MPSDQEFIDAITARQVNGSVPYTQGAFPEADAWMNQADRDRGTLLLILKPAKCVMKQGEPYDFAWCETHDITFPLGEKCKFDGRDPLEVWAEEADQQRQRAVRAEMELEQLRGMLSDD